MLSKDEEFDWITRLVELGLSVQRHLRPVLEAGPARLAQPVLEASGDTIYAVDRHVEPVITSIIEGWPAQCKPLILIAEGMGREGVQRFGPQHGDARYRLIIDPIDGTRSLMYDKRSAWFLAAVAPNVGAETSLADTFAAAMVELPTTKQAAADYFTAGTQHRTQGLRTCLQENSSPQALVICPSTATSLKDGFSQVSNFFPGTKILASDLMERIVLRTLGEVRPGRADVFDDQYISTGGQLVELMMGRDRFCCDLRPLFYDILDGRLPEKTPRGIECHPYDLAALLVAHQSGVILTDGFGQPLNGPLDVSHGMHWCGYANPVLQQSIQPVILEWLRENGITRSDKRVR